MAAHEIFSLRLTTSVKFLTFLTVGLTMKSSIHFITGWSRLWLWTNLSKLWLLEAKTFHINAHTNKVKNALSASMRKQKKEERVLNHISRTSNSKCDHLFYTFITASLLFIIFLLVIFFVFVSINSIYHSINKSFNRTRERSVKTSIPSLITFINLSSLIIRSLGLTSFLSFSNTSWLGLGVSKSF